jgi:hypothetical protein
MSGISHDKLEPLSEDWAEASTVLMDHPGVSRHSTFRSRTVRSRRNTSEFPPRSAGIVAASLRRVIKKGEARLGMQISDREAPVPSIDNRESEGTETALLPATRCGEFS